MVHFTHVRERADLSDQLVEAERAAGVARLPTLLISSKASITLNDRTTQSRLTAMLHSPMALARFLAAIAPMLKPASAAA